MLKPAFLALAAILSLSSCTELYKHKPMPSDNLEDWVRFRIILKGSIERFKEPWWVEHTYEYDYAERLNFMKPPVRVTSSVVTKHGIIHPDKYRTYDVTVLTGDGLNVHLGDIPLEVKAGDLLVASAK